MRAIDGKLPERTDVVVIGAGIVGAFNALNLAKRGVRVVLIDKLGRPSYKVGESCFGYTATFLHLVGGITELMTRQFPKHGIWVSSGLEHQKDFTRANELGLVAENKSSKPGDRLRDLRSEAALVDRQIVRPEIEAALLEQIRAHPLITLVDDARVTDVELGAGPAGLHRVVFEKKEPPSVRASGFDDRVLFTNAEDPYASRAPGPPAADRREIRCRWLIDCSGRRRFLVKKLGLDRPWGDDFQTTAVWGHFGGIKLLPEVWCLRGSDPRRRLTDRSQYTQHIWGDGYWIWYIPLTEGRLSLGVTYAQDRAPAGDTYRDKFWDIMRRYPIIMQSLEGAELLEFQVFANNQHQSGTHISADRFALAGDASTIIDPYYSQGLALSFATSWHASNVIERDLFGGELDIPYIDRINEALENDWLIHRSMVKSKFYHAERDPRFLMLSELFDFAHLMFVEKLPLTQLLTETEGRSTADTLKRRALRWYLERHLFLSQAYPWGLFLSPAQVRRTQEYLQSSAAARSARRLLRGEKSGILKFVFNEPRVTSLPFEAILAGELVFLPFVYLPAATAAWAHDVVSDRLGERRARRVGLGKKAEGSARLAD